jgi:hypothetical protein
MLARCKGLLICIVCLGVCGVSASQWKGEYIRRLQAHHVRETVFVSAGHRQLSGFFDGLRPDPRWSPERAALGARQARRCGASQGLVARLLSVFERVVYADGPCPSTSCSGNFNSQAPSQPCGTNNVCSSYDTTYGSEICNNGAQYSGSLGCTGSDPSCTGACSVQTCDDSQNCGGGGGPCGGGCCVAGPCSQNSDCCSGNCNQHLGLCWNDF